MSHSKTLRIAVPASVLLALVLVLPSGASLRLAKHFPVGLETLDVAIADVTGDGKRDLLATARGEGQITVYRGKGDGRFHSGQDFPAGDSPLGIATADFDRDGTRDIAVANQAVGGGFTVLLADGGNGFESPNTYPSFEGTSDYVVTGRFGTDRKVDLAVGNDDSITVFRGDGTGSFTNSPAIQLPNQIFGLRSGDVDRDGRSDLVAASSDAPEIRVLRGRRNGSFRAPKTLPVQEGPNDVTIGRVNRDRIPDLVVANYSDDTISVILGRGNGMFRPQRVIRAGVSPAQVEIFDFDGNRNPDIAVTQASDAHVLVLSGRGQGRFRKVRRFGVEAGPYGLAVGRINQDGKDDLASANYSGQSASVLLGK